MKRLAVLPLAVLALAGIVEGQAYSVYGIPRLFVTGDTSPGGAMNMVLSSPLDKNRPFMLLYSMGTGSPFSLPDGRSIGINVFLPGTFTLDPLFNLSTTPGLGGESIFGTPLPQSGYLDQVGTGAKPVTMPNLPAIIGVNFYAVALILNPAAPSAVQTISNVVTITGRDPATPVHYIRVQNMPGVPGWNGTTSGTVGGIMNGTASGMCRIKAATPPPAGKGGIDEHTDVFEVRGYNNGPNGISENGAGDDVNLGPVPVTWSDSTPTLVGGVHTSTGVFTAGPLTSTQANGVPGGYGTITATLNGNPSITASKQIRVVPPDWVQPPLPAPQSLTAQAAGGTVVLAWSNPVLYTTIDIRRNGISIATGLPGSTGSWTDLNNGAGVYSVRGVQGTRTSAWTSVNAGSGTILNLSNNGSVLVNIGFNLAFYGNSFNQMWVNANGNITFGAADPTSLESAATLQSGPRRIAGLWDDFDPSAGGFVISTPAATTHRIEWVAVPENGVNNASTFFIEVRSNGQIQIGWPSVAISDGLVGICPGNNLNAATAINFSTVPWSGTPNQRLFEIFPPGIFDLNGLTRTFIPTNAQSTSYQLTSP